MSKLIRNSAAFLVTCLVSSAGFAQFGPNPIQPSNLTVKVEQVGTMPIEGTPPNIGSPVVIQNLLYLIDQNNAIYRLGGKTSLSDNPIQKIFDVSEAPDGLVLDNRQSILNVAKGKETNEIYVAFTSKTFPMARVPVHRLPPALPGVCCLSGEDVPDLYRLNPMPNSFALGFYPATRTEYQVLYRYRLAGNKLEEPEAIVVLETQSGPTHNGGGMESLPDGRIIFATGDALPFGTDGRAAPQDDSSHLCKILIVNPDNGSVEVAAKGVRNVQHMEYAVNGEEFYLAFADIGGATAEEVNYVSVTDLIDTSIIENFGWGRNKDGKAREGTFYVEPGIAGLFGEPPACGIAPSPEPGFAQPQAQYGRTFDGSFVAVSGPVTSSESFSSITGLFGDLPNGNLYATRDLITATDANVYNVNLIDANGKAITLAELAGGRPDPRLFRFPNGTAGVLLEPTGDFYRLTQVPR